MSETRTSLLAGGGRSCCRLSSVAAAAVSPCPAAVAGVRRAGACGLPVFARPRPVSRHPDSRSPLAASTWPVEQRRRANPTRAVLPWRRNDAAGPWPSCRSRTLRPVSGLLQNRNRGRLGCPLLLPEPRSVSTRSVSGRLSGRWTLPKPVAFHRYRERSPARRPLDGCRHRR